MPHPSFLISILILACHLCLGFFPLGLLKKNVAFVNCGLHASCLDYFRHFIFITVISDNDYNDYYFLLS